MNSVHCGRMWTMAVPFETDAYLIGAKAATCGKGKILSMSSRSPITEQEGIICILIEQKLAIQSFLQGVLWLR